MTPVRNKVASSLSVSAKILWRSVKRWLCVTWRRLGVDRKAGSRKANSLITKFMLFWGFMCSVTVSAKWLSLCHGQLRLLEDGEKLKENPQPEEIQLKKMESRKAVLPSNQKRQLWLASEVIESMTKSNTFPQCKGRLQKEESSTKALSKIIGQEASLPGKSGSHCLYIRGVVWLTNPLATILYLPHYNVPQTLSLSSLPSFCTYISSNIGN